MKRDLHGAAQVVLTVVAALTSLYHLYTGFFGTPEAFLHRLIHVALLMGISLMCYGAWRGTPAGKLPFYDWIVLGLWALSMGYLFYNYDWVVEHIGYTETFGWHQKVLGFIAVAGVLEACRRVIGWPLTSLVALSVVYAFIGPYMPWLLFHQGFTASRVIDNQYLLTDGIFGLPTHISSTYIFLFIVFGAFLEKSGFGQFTIDLATALTGTMRGGPAKVAVLASGLVGSISGSSTANAVITGSFTIPMMKRTGFKDYMAAAVEAAASTGGLIMPPVMASVGFLMAEYTGIPYVEVMKLIVLPAVLYFLSIGIMVHIYAVKVKVPTLTRKELPRLKPILLSRGHLVLPLFLLIFLLVIGKSPMFAVTYCILAIVVVSWLRKETRMGPRAIWQALADGSIQATVVTVAIVASGVMVGIFDLTGVAIKFSGLIVDIAGESLFLALILIMVATIILGMGLPLSSAYIIQVGIAIPALLKMLARAGFPEATFIPQAHLFVIFFSAFSAITPPTAPTTYAAAAIARSPIIPTAIEAMKLALPAFILPYMFILDPSLLLIGSAPQVAVGTVFALAGVIAMALAVQDYAFAPLTLLKRALFFLGGLLMIGPTLYWHVPGVLVAGGLFLFQWVRYGRRSLEKVSLRA